MKNIESKPQLEQNIRACFNIELSFVISSETDKPLKNNFTKLLPIYMIESLKDISLENNYLLGLMDVFLAESGYPMADCFDTLKELTIQQLFVLKEFVLYVSSYQIDLFDQAISQGLYAIEWNTQCVEIYNSLEYFFSPSLVLESSEVLLSHVEEIKEDDIWYQEDVSYLKELLANKSWKDITEDIFDDICVDTIDFIFLTNKARCFLIPSMILLHINIGFFSSRLEIFSLLTNSQSRLVARYLNLLNEKFIKENSDMKELRLALENYWNKFLLNY